MIKICDAVALTRDFLHTGFAVPVFDGMGGVEDKDVFFDQPTAIQSK